VRTIITHPLNKRNQKAKERKFAQGIIRRGLTQSIRGTAVFVYNKNRGYPHLSITFGSLSNAFYLALAKAPSHKNVLHALQQGLFQVIMLHEDTPESVVRWVVKFFNECFDGAEALG
jgi:hypothetical protein